MRATIPVMNTLLSIVGIPLALWAAARSPVSDRRRYGPWRQGARDAMHNFAHSITPVPWGRKGEAE